ncbi:MAG: nucleotidyltransferase domain-containing protein [Verrucomicrobia bacterium]|nr:nucleotidyltransferase domain-containing protein [Verrucomicrobiota bacterium]
MNCIDKHRSEIAALCRQYNVRELYVFGSILRRDDFGPGSDIDLAVIFDRVEISGSFDQYMDFKTAMEKLLGRPIDLVSLRNARNRVFLQSVNATKELVYAAYDVLDYEVLWDVVSNKLPNLERVIAELQSQGS